MHGIKKNILVFGATGFIGSRLVNDLISLNLYNIIVLVRKESDISRLKKNIGNIDIQYGNIEDYGLIEKILLTKSINIVIHLSSSLIPSSNFSEYSTELNQIILPTIRLLPLFSKLNIKLIFFSSGGSVYGISNKCKLSESENTFPINYYGQSKKILEDSILLENKISGLNYIIIRPSNPFGFGQNTNGRQGFIAVAIGNILNNKKITIWGDGNIIRDYISIDNLIEGVLKILLSSYKNQIFNLGSGIGYSLNEIVEILNEISGIKIKVVFEPKRSVDPPCIILDMTKFRNSFDLTSTTIKDGISDFFYFEKSNFE